MNNMTKVILMLVAGLILAQCSTYKIKPDMNKSGVVNKTPKWYVDYNHETMFKYQEAATAVSPDMELAVKKATLLAKAKLVNAYGRELIEEHMDICLEAGLNVEGINAEVAPGQWEFQIFAKGAQKAGDEIWIARYLLERTAESYGMAIDYEPKPLGKDSDWNGSGMHANFSNGAMRDNGDEAIFTKICEEFGKHIDRHMSVYGANNDQRLTGLHETQAIDEYSYGVSDRGASIRIPIGTVQDGWKGRLEDRRTASNADPYKVAAAIIKTTKEALA